MDFYDRINAFKVWNLTDKKTVFIYMCVTKIGEGMMKLISKEKKTVKSAFNDEFENYLKKQQLRTTFNGYEIESFSWYKKALGLV